MGLRHRGQGSSVTRLAGGEGHRRHRNGRPGKGENNHENRPRALNRATAERGGKEERPRHSGRELESRRLRLEWEDREGHEGDERNDPDTEECCRKTQWVNSQTGRRDCPMDHKARIVSTDEMQSPPRRKNGYAENERTKSQRAVNPLRGDCPIQAAEGTEHARRLQRQVRRRDLARVHSAIRRTPGRNQGRSVQSQQCSQEE